MRLSRRPKPFNSDDFIFKLKIDGWRSLAFIEILSLRDTDYPPTDPDSCCQLIVANVPVVMQSAATEMVVSART